MAFLKNPLSTLTKDKEEQRNMALLGSRNVLRRASFPLTSGDVVTPLNVAVGVRPETLAVWGIPGQILGFFIPFLCAAYGDRVFNRIRACVLLTLTGLLVPAELLVITLGPERLRTLTVYMFITTVVGIVYSVFSRFFAVVEATMEARAIHNEVRGRFWSIFGIIAGLVGIGMGFITTFLLKYAGARYGLALSCAIGSLLIIACAFLMARIRELPDLVGTVIPKKEKPPIFKSLKEVVCLKQFRILMPANFLRGMGNGFAGYVLLLAIPRMNLPSEYAGYTTIIGQVAVFVSYVILGLTMDRFGAGIVLPVTEVLMSVGIMMSVITCNPLVFLGAIFLWRVMSAVEESAVPLAHFDVVPVEVFGAFSAVRLGLLNITGALSGTIMGIALKWFAPTYVATYCCLMKLLCGIMFSYGVFAATRHVKAQQKTTE